MYIEIELEHKRTINGSQQNGTKIRVNGKMFIYKVNIFLI